MSAVLEAPLVPPSAWRSALPSFAVAVAAVLLLYGESFSSMVQTWERSATFTHCFLVPPIALWLVWRKRAELAALQPGPAPGWLLPLAAAAFAWLLGDLAAVNAVAQGAATALLVLLVPALLGSAVARVLAFPLGFLFFMVPIGDFLLPTLMGWTADFTVAALTATGVPVYREGLQFIIPSGAWSVVEACSGVRYLIASAMVGTLYANLNYRSLQRRLLFCAVAVLVPIVANWLRAYMIVMIGHLSNNELAVGVDHLIYGWVFFGIVIGLMFFIGARWAEPDAPAKAVQPTTDVAAVPKGRQALPDWLALALTAVLLAAPHAALRRVDGNAPTAQPQLALPALEGTVEPTTRQAPLRPVSAGAAAEAARVYGTAEGDVAVHIAYWRQQAYDKKLVSSANMLVASDDRQWNQVATGTSAVTAGGRALQLRSAELLNTGEQRMRRAQARRLEVRQFFWVDGSVTASSQWATVLGLKSRLAGRGDDGALVTVLTEGEAAQTGPRLDAFFGRHFEALHAQLDAVARRR